MSTIYESATSFPRTSVRARYAQPTAEPQLGTSFPRTSVRVFVLFFLTLATLTSFAGTHITQPTVAAPTGNGNLLPLVDAPTGNRITTHSAAAPTGTRIILQLGNAPDRDVLLAHYYGTSVYVDDTLRTDAQGKAVIVADTLLPQGLYMIYIDKDHRFDFMLGADQEFTLQTRSGRGEDLVIEGSAETKAFQDYTLWFRRQQARRSSLDSAQAKASGSARDSITRQISLMVGEVNKYWKSTAEKFPGSLLASFLMANYYEELKPEDIPAAWQANDSLKWTYQYNYRKENWFGHFNLADERLLYTPLVKNRLDSFFGQVLLQMYDSVKPPVYKLLKRAEPHPKMFRYMVSQLLNSSLNSTVMGMDALFVDLALDFYLSGKATWADSATMAKIRENVIFLENNLVGKPARDVQMEQFDGEPFRLYQQSNKYTILAFYEPGCSHCREYIPALYREIYLPYRDKGVEVVAGYTMADRAEWAKFLEQHQLHDWINVWDPNHLSRFKILYDTRVTPSVYLLDKDRKIIAKKFTIEFLHEYFKHYLK